MIVFLNLVLHALLNYGTLTDYRATRSQVLTIDDAEIFENA